MATWTEFHRSKSSVGANQLRKERLTALAVVVFFIVLMALLVWLAATGSAPEGLTDQWMFY